MIKTNPYVTAQDAINLSTQTGDIVHIPCSLDTVQADLLRVCEDWTDANPDENGEAIFEYWGQDDEGDGWRVHVHGAGAH